jgi:propionyl-CoA carboxylase alpha chain
MFDKILIANRGEIAIRIIRTCKKLGIQTVAVFSEIDSRSLHVREADEAAYLGPSPSESSYLLKDRIIEAATQHGCQAIHPGYGFLSENADFSRMTVQTGLVFIGPSAEAIATIGDKIASRNIANKVGMPVVPGHAQPIADPDEALSIAQTIGYPVLLKPAAGGGGRGMRIVYKDDEFLPALKTGQEEIRKAFADDRMFLERYVVKPRHIEIQIMADGYGNVLYLGERECSIQRRYQKIIEEAPSVTVDQGLRRQMGEMARALAREAGYTNAGTVEYILDPAGEFYFLEMNTRLQVEHPVTEMVTGLDLVELQLKVAAGEPLTIQQSDIVLEGWAIEARVCVEDPAKSFMPSSGLITRYAEPKGPNIRVDSGVREGSMVSVYYDNMVAKVISWGKSREEARKTLAQALNRYHIEGVTTNIDFLNANLNHPAFVNGDLSTAFIQEHFENGRSKIAPPRQQLEYMAMAATLVYHNRQNLVRKSLEPMAAKLGAAHLQEKTPRYMVKGESILVEMELVQTEDSNRWTITVDDKEYTVVTPDFEFYRRRLKLKIDNQYHYFRLQYAGNFIFTAFCGVTQTFEIYRPREWQLAKYMPEEAETSSDTVLFSPMPGLVVDIKVQEGERVYRGQDLLVIEAMKMESGVSSPRDGVIEEINVQIGQTVETNEAMMRFKQ